MRFHALPARLLPSASRVAVIAALFEGGKSTWTGSELARAAGVTPRWAIETLRSLEAEGVVHAEWSPPAWRWTVNRDHFLAKELRRVAGVEHRAQSELLGELRKAVAALNPHAAVWFGSTARGDEAPGSDVDLLVVVRGERQKAPAEDALSRRGGPFYRKFGNRLAPVVLTRAEFEARKRRGFVREALAEGVRVWGA